MQGGNFKMFEVFGLKNRGMVMECIFQSYQIKSLSKSGKSGYNLTNSCKISTLTI